jgi:hypothetical protein
MASKPSKSTATPTIHVQPAPAVVPGPIARYYRIRKLTGFLSEILEVEVDETAVKPVVVSKQDSAQFLMGRIEDLVLGKGKR